VTLADDLAPGRHVAEAAALVALPRCHRNVSVSRKLDGSLVTEVDLVVEQRLLEMLESAPR
jgi:fructose-1,6-bisphosphatase/inositol monophosphatase family enzyme